MKLRRHLIAPLALALGLLAAPSAAQAATMLIDGAPLNIHVGDTGQLQVRFDGQTGGEFFSSSSDEAQSGFMLGAEVGGQLPTLYGFKGTAFQNTSHGAVTGSGTAADPFAQVTTFTAPVPSQGGSLIIVTQTTTYVNGEQSFRQRWDIGTDATGPFIVRPTMSADLYVSGSDSGVGFLEGAAPNRVVGGVNQNAGASGGIVEITPWHSFEENRYTTVFDHAGDLTPGNTAGFTNSILADDVDNGAGVQWPDTTIGFNQAYTVESAWRFTRFEGLTLDPAQTRRAAGGTQTVTLKAQANQGQPAANTVLRYEITGANPSSGAVTTGPDGVAPITWTGTNAGIDNLSVTADLNGNGTGDSNEPQRTATVEWLGATLGSTFAVEPVRGSVLVKLPRGASPARYGLKARASQAKGGFIPLTAAGVLPIRTEVDTTKGEIRLTSAADAAGRIQTANFYSGRFQVQQKRSSRPITDMVLKGGSFRRCPSSRAKGSDAGDAPEALSARSRGRRVRRVWGNGRGRFRTRGRYSSATVRGTTWLTQDHCNGTLTKVARRPRTNRVVVRDLVKRRNRTIRAGRSYFAFKRGK